MFLEALIKLYVSDARRLHELSAVLCIFYYALQGYWKNTLIILIFRSKFQHTSDIVSKVTGPNTLLAYYWKL